MQTNKKISKVTLIVATTLLTTYSFAQSATPNSKTKVDFTIAAGAMIPTASDVSGDTSTKGTTTTASVLSNHNMKVYTGGYLDLGFNGHFFQSAQPLGLGLDFYYEQNKLENDSQIVGAGFTGSNGSLQADEDAMMGFVHVNWAFDFSNWNITPELKAGVGRLTMNHVSSTLDDGNLSFGIHPDSKYVGVFGAGLALGYTFSNDRTFAIEASYLIPTGAFESDTTSNHDAGAIKKPVKDRHNFFNLGVKFLF